MPLWEGRGSKSTTRESQFAREIRPLATHSKAEHSIPLYTKFTWTNLPLHSRKHTSTFCSTKNLLSRPPLKEIGPWTGVSLTPPRRRRERTSSTRFRHGVATSMRWKFIVPTRTCRVCSLLRFDGKKWCFFASFRQFNPIAVPRPVVLQQVQTLCVHTND